MSLTAWVRQNAKYSPYSSFILCIFEDLANRFPVIEIPSRRCQDFMETAAIMTHLDLVITPDTALAHLAGALGLRAWAGLCTADEWRWLAGREDTPWYPTMRLFRQTTIGDWDGVFRRMTNALKEELQKIAAAPL